MKLWGIIACLLLCGCSAEFITADSTIQGVRIQPAEALEMAQSHLEKHGTTVWKNADNLKTHLVRKGRFYYVKKSDYPAKTANWYLFSSIKINCRTGELSYVGP
jgi:hypothetical protein